MPVLRKVRVVLWGLVTLLVVGVGTIALIGPGSFDGAGSDNAGDDATTALVGGPFELVDGAGRPVTDRDFRGEPFAIFFGFTHCPDVCPTSLYEMAGWIEALGPAAGDMRFAFVTIDPERDKPETLAGYVGSFSDAIVPLTGTRAQIDAVLGAYRVYARKVPLDGDDYTMDHSAFVYLMDEDGRYRAHITYGESEERAVAKLKDLLASS